MVIIGAKGFAKEVLEVLYQQQYGEEIYFFDNVTPDLPLTVFDRYKVLKSFDEVQSVFKNGQKKFTLGIGIPKNRKKLHDQLIAMGGQFTSTISPFAHIGNFDNFIGEGCNIMTGTVITNSVRIEKGVLINLNCTVGHDSMLSEFCELSPGTHISGNCTVGKYCIFGTNSSILPKLKIGDNVVVGAGAVVTKDVPSNSLVVGIPAKVVKELPELTF